jgi:hypothetical protein
MANEVDDAKRPGNLRRKPFIEEQRQHPLIDASG